MKIRQVQIKNYRSLKDITIYPENILALVGRNNAGKSNIIKALELFFESSTRLVDEDCYYNHNSKEKIEIIITFKQLSPWEKQALISWMRDDDTFIVKKEIICNTDGSINIVPFAIKKVPDIEWLREDKITGEAIKGWWSNRAELKIGDLDFGAKLGTSRPNVGQWKELAENFLESHSEEIPLIEQYIENPKGYPGVLKGALPEFIYIPAVRDVLEEAKVEKTNPFGQLINSVLGKIPEDKKSVISKQLKDVEKYLNRSDEKTRFPEIKQIETKLNDLMSELMECDIEINLTVPKLADIFSKATIYADDGIRTPIDTKGHGMQRSLIFTILRAYAELAHIKKAGEKAKERTTIFAIEEPELYLHPQSQRTLMAVFQNIAAGMDQIIYSTQSSLFVNIKYFDQICVIRRQKKENTFESVPTQLTIATMIEDLRARKEKQATEKGIRELYSHAFNPMINEGFFSDKVVIVEGPSEQYSLPIYANALKLDMDRENISVVHSDGKGQMDRILRIFNGFKIPTYLMFDGDKNNDDKEILKKSKELLELMNNPIKDIQTLTTKVSDNYTVLEFTFEDTLKTEIEDYEKYLKEAGETLGPTGKPLKHRYIANKFKERVDKGEQAEGILPKTIVSIIGKIKKMVFSGNVLQKKEISGEDSKSISKSKKEQVPTKVSTELKVEEPKIIEKEITEAVKVKGKDKEAKSGQKSLSSWFK